MGLRWCMAAILESRALLATSMIWSVACCVMPGLISSLITCTDRMKLNIGSTSRRVSGCADQLSKILPLVASIVQTANKCGIVRHWIGASSWKVKSKRISFQAWSLDSITATDKGAGCAYKYVAACMVLQYRSHVACIQVRAFSRPWIQ